MVSGEGNVAFAFSWSTQALVLPRLAKQNVVAIGQQHFLMAVVAPFFVATGGVMALGDVRENGFMKATQRQC